MGSIHNLRGITLMPRKIYPPRDKKVVFGVGQRRDTLKSRYLKPLIFIPSGVRPTVQQAGTLCAKVPIRSRPVRRLFSLGAYCPQSPEKMNERRNNVYERYMSPTPEKLLNANESLLAKAICEAGNKGPKFGAEKAAKLREAAGSAQVIGVRSASNASLIKNVLDIIEGLLAAIQRIEGEIKELVTQDTRLDEDVKLLCSIPGIGFSSAVVIAAEMGNISLFRKPKQLAAYFGLDPGERQSGTFKGRKNKLSKRGSPQVRAALHMAAVSSVSRNRDGTYRNPVLAEYYERKCAEKPCKVARVAVMRKLSNIIYAVLRDRRPFELRTPQEHMALLAAA